MLSYFLNKICQFYILENLPESDKHDLQDKPLKDNSENKVDEVDLGDTSSEKMEVDGEKMDWSWKYILKNIKLT